MAEKALNSRQTPLDLPAGPGRPTFEVQLTPVVCYGTGDREPQHGDPGGGGGDHRSLQPSLELPSDPVHHGSRGKGVVPSPPTLQRLAMFGLGLDEQLGSGQSMRSEATDELIGKPYGNKGQGVSPVGRWVESPVNREICWRVPESERSLVETPGKPVSKAAFGTKPSQHRPLVQLGELAQRANPEPAEDVGEHWQAENLHAEVTEPLSDRTMRHNHAFVGGEPGRKRAIGNPYLARWLRRGGAGPHRDGPDSRGCRVPDLRGEGNLPTEVTGGGSDR